MDNEFVFQTEHKNKISAVRNDSIDFKEDLKAAKKGNPVAQYSVADRKSVV